MFALNRSSDVTLRRDHVRDDGIDAFRFAMAIFVIVLHTVWETFAKSAGSAPGWAESLNIISRAAVPFFFVASGYYLRTEASLVKLVVRPITRLLPIFVVWMVAYHAALYIYPLLPLNGWGVLGLLNGGAAYHLWFLPALAGALIFVGVAIRLLGVLPTTLVAVVLALIGPILHDYHPLLGMTEYPQRLSFVDRQMAAPLFVLFGTQLRDRLIVSTRVAAATVAACYMLLFAETAAISQISNVPIIKVDFSLATFLLGPAMFILARSLTDDGLHRGVVALGKLSLAVYLSHLYLVWVLAALVQGTGFAAMAIIVLAVSAAATAIAALVVRVGFLRKLAT